MGGLTPPKRQIPLHAGFRRVTGQPCRPQEGRRWVLGITSVLLRVLQAPLRPCATRIPCGIYLAPETSPRYGADGTGPSIYIQDPDGNTVELKGTPSL